MLDIKVTTVNKVYHSCLFENGIKIDEMSCQRKEDIGYICREMLRWYSKMGGFDPWAESARRRQIGPKPKGIKYLVR